MNTPEAASLAVLLPDWEVKGNPFYGLQIVSPCKRVRALLNRETLVFGKGRSAIRKTEWVLRITGKPGFDGIGNEDYHYFARALNQAVANADAAERQKAEEAEARKAQAETDRKAIHGFLAECGFFR